MAVPTGGRPPKPVLVRPGYALYLFYVFLVGLIPASEGRAQVRVCACLRPVSIFMHR